MMIVDRPGYFGKKRPQKIADYDAKYAPLYADYDAKRDALYAVYYAKRAPLDADYDAKRASLFKEIFADNRNRAHNWRD